MSNPPTNLRVLRPSRHRPVAGDVFALQVPDRSYLFGRVILVEPDRAPMPLSYLIYVYDHRGSDKAFDIRQLRPDRLLIPPVWINRMPWAKGYFETLANLPIDKGDLLEQHCFVRWTGELLDETGATLPQRVEPCGDWALSSYRWLDDRISDALSIPRAPSGDG